MIVGSFFHRLLKSVEDFQLSLFLAFDIQHVSTFLQHSQGVILCNQIKRDTPGATIMVMCLGFNLFVKVVSRSD